MVHLIWPWMGMPGGPAEKGMARWPGDRKGHDDRKDVAAFTQLYIEDC